MPSPKVQLQLLTVPPVEMSLKTTVIPTVPLVGVPEKSDTGAGSSTVIKTLVEWLPPGPVTSNTTEKLPALWNRCSGLGSIDEVASPKSHAQLSMEPVLLSVNCTSRGAIPLTTEVEKLATGGGVGESTTTAQLTDGPEAPPTVAVNA